LALKETKALAIASAPEILADNAKYVSDHLLKAVITNNIFSAASFIGLGARGVVEPITYQTVQLILKIKIPAAHIRNVQT
jgi:hypothetical protein